MTRRLFAKHRAYRLSSVTGQNLPDGGPDDAECKESAAAALLRHGVLSHTFGEEHEYEVRTTMDTREAWRYRSCVFHDGKVLKKGFSPIVVDNTHQMEHLRRVHGITDGMRLSFAREAAELHFTRCAVLREYLIISMIYSKSPRESTRWYSLPGTLIGIGCLMAYGLWNYAAWTHSEQPPRNPTPQIQRAQYAVVDQDSTPSPSNRPQDAVNGMAMHDDVNEPPPTSPITRHPEAPRPVDPADLPTLQPGPFEASGAVVDFSNPEVIRQVQLQLKALGFDPGVVDGDFGPRTEAALFAYQSAHHLPKTGRLDAETWHSLTLQDPLPQGAPVPRIAVSQVLSGAAGLDVDPGDVVLVTGWIYQVARDPDGTYRLQVGPSPQSRGSSLIAVVPHPDQASAAPTARAQLESVRAFIRQRLLRQQEPSPRGSVMRSPSFVQLRGQLAPASTHLGESSQGRKVQDAAVRWELHQVVEMQFAPPPTSAESSRRR